MKKTTETTNLPDEENPEFMFQTIHGDLVYKIASGNLNAQRLAKLEMISRGTGRNGKHVGFEKAEKEWFTFPNHPILNDLVESGLAGRTGFNQIWLIVKDGEIATVKIAENANTKAGLDRAEKNLQKLWIINRMATQDEAKKLVALIEKR